MSRDIGNTVSVMVVDVEASIDHLVCHGRRSEPGRDSPLVWRVAELGIEADGPIPSRGRRGVRSEVTAAVESPNETPAETVDTILELRRTLTNQGLDAGPETIAWHLDEHHGIEVSPATIRRRLVAAGLIRPEPRKRPKSSYIRFQADVPNEMWQTDMTHVRLADDTDIEVLPWFDDHSRYALNVTAHPVVNTSVVVTLFRETAGQHGYPASVLSDNGMYYTARFARGGRSGLNRFETLLTELGIDQKHSRPNHPTTCGKVERFQQTMKKWLRARPPATALLRCGSVR